MKPILVCLLLLFEFTIVTLLSSTNNTPVADDLTKAPFQRKSRIWQTYTFDLPANVAAKLTLPFSSEDTILLNEKNVTRPLVQSDFLLK